MQRIVQKEKNLRYPQIRLVLFGHKIIDEEEIIKLKMYEEIDGKEKNLNEYRIGCNGLSIIVVNFDLDKTQ
ncbi:hypothetical protein [Waltera sp.]|uniref:hypothetical protein n=1 Tax=Waltera sp. TaxID=2815806 RepID=UPI0039A1233D